MLILSQYHIFESYKINIYSAVSSGSGSLQVTVSNKLVVSRSRSVVERVVSRSRSVMELLVFRSQSAVELVVFRPQSVVELVVSRSPGHSQ